MLIPHLLLTPTAGSASFRSTSLQTANLCRRPDFARVRNTFLTEHI